MLPSRFLLHGICLLVMVSIVAARCGEPTPRVYQTVIGPELNTSDVLFTFNGSLNGTADFYGRPINKTWTIHYYSLFVLQKLGATFKALIRNPGELRSLLQKHGTNICGLGLELRLYCYNNQSTRMGNAYVRYVYIRPPENKFTINAYNAWFNLREDSVPATWSESLLKLITTPKSEIAKYRFVQHAYNGKIGWYDARAILTLHTNGTFRLHTTADAEEWSPEMRYHLNMTVFISLFICKGQSTVEHGPWQSLTGLTTFKLINVNDSPPRFVRGACPPACGPPNYKAWVTRTFTGRIWNVQDGPIGAHDPDGDLNQFSFSGGSPSSYNQYFEITNYFGRVSVTRPLGNVQVDVFNITIKVKSYTNLPPHARVPARDTAYTSLIVVVRPTNWWSALASSKSLSTLPCFMGIIVMIAVVLLM